jgi:hypothetical protein
MLTRNSQIGEFYVMSPPQVPPQGESTMYTCDIMIFDEERDAHVRISWNEALKATLCTAGSFAADGTANNPSSFLGSHGTKNLSRGAAGKKKFNEWAAAASAWAEFNSSKEGNYAEVETKHGKDVRIIVARPFIEHAMHNVIMAVAGRDTGATLFGPADMQLSANTQVKTIEGHYTGHFKAVVTKPQNVLVMRDVACAGYVAGCNTRWFAKDEAGNFTADQAAQAIQDRLSFADDNTDRYASMLAFPCYEGQFESGQLDTVMSVTTRLLPWEVNNAGVHNSFPGGPEAYAAYSGALQLAQVHYGEDMKAAENQDFISQAYFATFEPPPFPCRSKQTSAADGGNCPRNMVCCAWHPN